MCGFAAILTQHEDLYSRFNVMKDMLGSISHRGPDGEGINHVPGKALLGHRRLAIIDIEHGIQPMCDLTKRYSLIYNGEIYNYLELSEQLSAQGIILTTSSDTEVLLHLLIQKGTDALHEINGMFAFLFHDKEENSWIAARDHFGIKPLYFAELPNELLFASEIKGILVHPDVKIERDNRSLQQYLSFQFCLDDRTLFKGIRKVRPGYYLVGKGSKILNEVPYWDINYQIDYDHTESWFLEKLRFLLKDSVRLQIRADVPLGTYLSGGIDSSLVSVLASQYFDHGLPMFHGRFKEGLNYDESEYAKEVVKKSKGIYFETVPTEHDFVNQLPGLIQALDEPLAGPGLFPQFATSKLAANHVKVVLGGQGGDEIFGGYARYLVGYLEQALKGAILETQEEGNHLVTLESIVPNLALLKQYTPLIRNFWSKGVFQGMDMRYFHLIDRSQGIEQLLHEDSKNTIDRKALFEDFQAIFNDPDTQSYINKMTHFDQKTLLPALLQIEDRVSMAVSIESRVPLLDRRIVDLVTSMPPQIKFQGGRAKNILKKSISDWLPPKILNRKDKMGFPVPLEKWMQRGIVREFVADILLSKKSIQRGIYSSQALSAMIDKQGVGGRQLWGALSLELWHKAFIDVR